MGNDKARHRLAFKLAKEHLLGFKKFGVTPEVLGRYLKPDPNRPKNLSGIYKALLLSAQNSNMKSGVIGKAIGGFDSLGRVLDGFSPSKVTARYGDDWKRLLKDVEKRLQPAGKIRKTRRSIWPNFCKCILSSASFMVQFSDAKDFYGWVSFFNRDTRSRMSLPLLMSAEIHGVGFALACDFLKELGYFGYPKPDVHLRKIFEGLGFCPKGSNDLRLCRAIVSLAKDVGVTPYEADKVFWLVGSGRFYLDEKTVGKKGKVKINRAGFIRATRRKMEKRFGQDKGRRGVLETKCLGYGFPQGVYDEASC